MVISGANNQLARELKKALIWDYLYFAKRGLVLYQIFIIYYFRSITFYALLDRFFTILVKIASFLGLKNTLYVGT